MESKMKIKPLTKRVLLTIGMVTFLSTASLFTKSAMATPSSDKEITIACGSQGIELRLCKEGVALWTKKTGYPVKVISTPNTSTERLAMYQQLLSGESEEIDVYQIDVIWPGILGSHFIDLSEKLGDEAQQFIPALIENNTYKNHLVAVPWFGDAILNFYRKDLLEKYNQPVPTTYEELTKTAQYIMDKERATGDQNMWGYVWQGKAYEGLTYNFLEWVQAYHGGNMIEADGTISINNPTTVNVLKMAKQWIGTISPEGTLNHAVEDTRGIFQSGHAVFMHNWPYAYNLAQAENSPIRNKVGIAPMPKGGVDGIHAATLGGWQLAVSRYSDHQSEAADLVMFLTSYQEQKRRAIEGGYGPTRLAVYRDNDVQNSGPLFGMMEEIVLNATVRPSTVTGSYYNQVSNYIYNAAHSYLSGHQTAEKSVKSAEKRLKALSRNGQW